MYIPDPTEILDRQIEDQANLIDGSGEYPCAQCGKRFPAEDMFPASGQPAAPLLGGGCARDAEDIKTVCSWCEKHLAGLVDAKKTSHGICPACERKHFPDQEG